MDKRKKVTTNHMPKQSVYRLVIVLTILCLISIMARFFYFGPQSLAGGDKIWRLSIGLTTAAKPDATSLKIYPPFDTSNIRIIERSLFHPNIRIRNSFEDDKTRRSIFATTSAKGQQTMIAEYFLHASDTPFTSTARKSSALDTRRREIYLQDTEELQLNSYMVQKVVKELLSRQLTQSQLIDEIYLHLKTLSVNNNQPVLNVPHVLAKKGATILDKSLAMVALCRAVGIPARLVTGFILKDDIEPQLYYWVEVYSEEHWLSYDVHYGYKQSVPINYLPMRRNSADLVQVVKGEIEKIEYDLEQEYDHPYLNQDKDRGFFSVFDLSRLPLDVRNELAILLLLPLGALITALFRHLVGVHSFGVFTPTLLALAAVYNDLFTTAIIFFVVCSLAVVGRSLFPDSISRTPRLSIIFTLVAIVLVISVSVMDQFELNQSGKIILLPVVILTTLVDNLYRTIEERGMEIAMGRLLWTNIIMLLCLPVVQFEALGNLILKYPEVHLLTLASFLVISIYKGKQLIDIPIIRLLAEPKHTIKKEKGKTNAS